jgi:hypothetical protein
LLIAYWREEVGGRREEVGGRRLEGGGRREERVGKLSLCFNRTMVSY